MNDEALTLASAFVELGLPLGLLIAMIARPDYRSKLIVILGSITPAIAMYLWIAFEYLVLDRVDDAGWAFYAMWAMSFFPYLGCALLGLCLCFVPVPKHLVLRFGLGLLAPATVAGLIALGF
jgi:hypothetical protein